MKKFDNISSSFFYCIDEMRTCQKDIINEGKMYAFEFPSITTKKLICVYMNVLRFIFHADFVC